MKIAVYPGSFDPVTNGHLDVIDRASKMFDKVVVAILLNVSKNPCFSIEERISLIQSATKDIKNIEVESFSGLLVDYMTERNANIIIKGLRNSSDFEYEYPMALMNKKLVPTIETVFLISNQEYSYVSSSLVKEVAVFDGNLQNIVPEEVEEALKQKYKK